MRRACLCVLFAAACGGGSSKPAEEPENTASEPIANTAPADAPAVSTISTGLPGCDAYIRAVESYTMCDKIPQAARDSAKQGIDAMKQGWGDMSQVPEDVRAQTNDACLQAIDALRQGAGAMGCRI